MVASRYSTKELLLRNPFVSKNCGLFFFMSDLPESFGLQIQGTALVLDEIINHVQSLQRQVEVGLFVVNLN